MALSSKKKRSRSDASGDEAPAAGEDVPFPRGGASLLTPLEERKLKVRAKADFEREAAGSSRGPEKKKKKRRSAENDKDAEVRAFTSCTGPLRRIQSAAALNNLGSSRREACSRFSQQAVMCPSLWIFSSSLCDPLHR